MAYVIAVCGAGGKTTLCKSKARQLAIGNKKVCITTTTNMWFESDVQNNYFNISEANTNRVAKDIEIKHNRIYYAGNINEKKRKLTPLNKTDYEKLCEVFDYVIVEADGSRAMPMKIPYGIFSNDIENKNVKFYEPVIPENVDEIIIVVGMEAVGREIAYVCHRFNEFYGKDKYLSDNNIKPSTIVTENLIDNLTNFYYYEPLKNKFKKAKISIYKKDYFKKESLQKFVSSNEKKDSKIHLYRLCLSLCASGFSRRFGDENKLFIDISKKDSGEHLMLYQLMIEKLLKVRESVLGSFSKVINCDNLLIDIVVVTQYDEIINDKEYKDKVNFIKNNRAEEGLSSSLKLTIENYKDYDAVLFINSDLPKLDEDELSRFIVYSILNNNSMAAMFTDNPKNPAYFEKKYFNDIMQLDGDRGAKELLLNNIKDLYRYYINPDKLFDIDTIEDYNKL